MLPVNCGSHADYQHFVVTNFRKYYPDPDALARSTWDIIERFWNLDLSFTDTFMADKYSKFGPTPRTPSCMQRSYLLSIDFNQSIFDQFLNIGTGSVRHLRRQKFVDPLICHCLFCCKKTFFSHDLEPFFCSTQSNS